MCTYTYAPLCAVRGNTGVEKEETPPPATLTGSRPPVTCSPLILFSLTVLVVVVSLAPSVAYGRFVSSSPIRHPLSLPLSLALFLPLLLLPSPPPPPPPSYPFVPLTYILSFLSVFLSISFIRNYASTAATQCVHADIAATL